jgi:site-specific DNA-methyltransferase (adenine-specific)
VRVETIGKATLYLGDCLEIIPTLGKVDAVITDPPYPNVLTEEYRYRQGCLEAIGITRGLIFWPLNPHLPIPYSSIHIWDKKINVGRDYEIIYEVGGNNEWKMFRHYLINSTVAASFVGDTYTGHKSQKPVALMRELVKRCEGAILDPFMGSGTTGVACMELQRPFVGIEIHAPYFDIACERIENVQRQERLFA